MASAHEISRFLYEGSIAGAYYVPDPGTAGTIDIGEKSFGVCSLTIAAANEVRTLPDATVLKPGVHLIVVVGATGAGFYSRVGTEVLWAAGDCFHYVTYFNGTTHAWANVTNGMAAGTFSAAPITLTASTPLSAISHANRTLLMGASGAALTFTLPAATGSGKAFQFYVSVVNTSNYVIDATTSTFGGAIVTKTASESNDVAQAWAANPASAAAITLNGTTTGGVYRGDWVCCTDILTGIYSVRGLTNSSGAEATPFS